MLQASFDFEGAASAPAPTLPAATKRRRKPASVVATNPPTWMVAVPVRDDESVCFLAADNYHHDRPDDAPTCLTDDPRRSPRFGSLDAAHRAVRLFPSDRGWNIFPTDEALMRPRVILGFLERANLPHRIMNWGVPYDVGTFAIETLGRAGRNLSFRVTYSHSDREFATLHAVEGVLSRCYRVHREDEQVIRDGRHICTLTHAVLVTGVLPQTEWFDPQP